MAPAKKTPAAKRATKSSPVKKADRKSAEPAPPPVAKPALSKAATPTDALRWLVIRGARHNNLKNLTVAFPLARFVCVTGVSGSGKSSLVNDILFAAAAAELNKAELEPGDYDRIDGLEHLDKVIDIDQSPIGRTPRSNPATYTKVFDEIRDLYAGMPEAKMRGYPVGRFSFNVEGGRCEACEGNGATRQDMEFLADVWTTCPVCEGRRFNRETLDIRYKGKTIADVLGMDIQTALEHFDAIPKIRQMLQTLHDVGLNYIKLGQSSTTLSGGEAQRIKLAKELGKRSTGRTLYILDEPTTGLHFADVARLLRVLQGFVDAGNTVVVIEHNLDVIKSADWLIDLGPEGGAGGGRILVEGTPEVVAACDASPTGRALRAVLPTEVVGRWPLVVGQQSGTEEAVDQQTATGSPQPFRQPTSGNQQPTTNNQQPTSGNGAIEIIGARQHNLQNVTVALPRGEMTVLSGLSGSGKTSLAMDTLYTEGQRRYVESLSAYARQFLGRLARPAVDDIRGLSPAIAIEQKNMSGTPRSTVGTVTEIYDYLRVLWARIGVPHCTACGGVVGTRTVDQIVEEILTRPAGTRVLLLAPMSAGDNRSYDDVLRDAKKNGFIRARIDGAVVELSDDVKLDRRQKHTVELVVDRNVIKPESRSRLAEAVESATGLTGGRLILAPAEPRAFPEQRFNLKRSCRECGAAYEELTPHHFSFNAALGWCSACDGLGVQAGANPAVLVPNPHLSIRGGAIAGWSLGHTPTYFGGNGAPPQRVHIGEPTLTETVEAVCEHIGLSLDTPWEKLPETGRHKILHGTGADWITVRPGLAVRFLGLFPAVSRATKMSWTHREKLSELVADVECGSCQGGRIRPDAAAARVAGRTLVELCRMPLADALRFFTEYQAGLSAEQQAVVGELLREIIGRLRFLVDVGLEYLHLHRSAPTLSGGESQRIQLAGRLGSGLTGVTYVLDEPTIGLHPRDTDRLIRALTGLRDLGNTLVVVEHDREVIAAADNLVDFGPGAGREGGRIVAQGRPTELIAADRAGDPAADPGTNGSVKASPLALPSDKPSEKPSSLTVQFLSGRMAVGVPTRRRAGNGKWLELLGARHNNLHDVDVRFPLGTLIAVTGVSGSGKSSLIGDVLYPALAKRLHRATLVPGEHRELRGVGFLNKVIRVDQTPLGSTPTSNPATYTGAFDHIRLVFARLPESRQRGWNADRFSFNKEGGRCEACEGAGRRKIEMHFLADVWIECESCRGRRYDSTTLAVAYNGKNISEVLNLRVDEAARHFAEHPRLVRILQTLTDVGLGYMQLGQSADTLSGGESQRVRLAGELSRPDTGRTLYLLDEPTTGLHFEDVRKLLGVLNRLVAAGNTVVVIEHNPDMIKSADWIVDMGPEAGAGGGRLVAAGTPEHVATVAASHTGRMLVEVLAASPKFEPPPEAPPPPPKEEPPSADLADLADPMDLAAILASPNKSELLAQLAQVLANGRKSSRSQPGPSHSELAWSLFAEPPPDRFSDEDDDTADRRSSAEDPGKAERLTRELLESLEELLDADPVASPNQEVRSFCFDGHRGTLLRVVRSQQPRYWMKFWVAEPLATPEALRRIASVLSSSMARLVSARPSSDDHWEVSVPLSDAPMLENAIFRGYVQQAVQGYIAEAETVTLRGPSLPRPRTKKTTKKVRKK